MTQRERWQWAILIGLLVMLMGIIVWNAFRPAAGPSGRMPVIEERARRSH